MLLSGRRNLPNQPPCWLTSWDTSVLNRKTTFKLRALSQHFVVCIIHSISGQVLAVLQVVHYHCKIVCQRIGKGLLGLLHATTLKVGKISCRRMLTIIVACNRSGDGTLMHGTLMASATLKKRLRTPPSPPRVLPCQCIPNIVDSRYHLYFHLLSESPPPLFFRLITLAPVCSKG